MPNPTIDVCSNNIVTKDDLDSSIVFEKESPHHFSALKDYLTRSLRTDTTSTTDVSNIVPKERISFHSSNDRTALTLEMSSSDIEESSITMGDDEDNGGDSGAIDNPFHRSSTLRLSMCGAIHETDNDTKSEEFNDSKSDWSSVASSVKEEEEDIAGAQEEEVKQERVVFHRRASNPLMLGRRFSAQGSRRDSVMSASMQEAFQLVRDTFEHQQPPNHVPPSGGQQHQPQEGDEVSDLDDDDDDDYDHFYGYGDAVPDDKNVADSMAPANRKASVGQQQRQQDATDYGYGDATPDNRPAVVDYGYGDAVPDRQTSATEFKPPSNAPPCVSWDVQEVDDAAKYGYGESPMASRRQSGAHYDYGYGSDHDMDSTWHHGENMGNQANRILPHQDPAVVQTQPSRRMRQRQNTLRRSWNAQEQPRRRVQRRSSVTKYNLEESMAKVQQEEEKEGQEVTSVVAQNNPTPRSYSMVGSSDKPKTKRKLRFFRSRVSSGNHAIKSTRNSRTRLHRLRDIFTLGPSRRSSSSNTTTASTIQERDISGSSMLASNNSKPKAIPKRNSRFRLWFRRGRRQPKDQLV